LLLQANTTILKIIKSFKTLKIMAVPSKTIWKLDPHTVAKHEILRRYLQRWFPILESSHSKVIYIDGFCGPGRYEDGEQGSPLVVLDLAVNHAKKLSSEIIFSLLKNAKTV
jgi:hypothetical protein